MRAKVILAVIILFSNCTDNIKERTEGVHNTIIDPNKTSEMALLMRDMFVQLESIKINLESGEDISSAQFDFANIHEQTPTDESFINENFKAMSMSYSATVALFNEQRSKENFMSIVNNCMSCHQNLCPGPIERIEKLIIQ